MSQMTSDECGAVGYGRRAEIRQLVRSETVQASVYKSTIHSLNQTRSGISSQLSNKFKI